MKHPPFISNIVRITPETSEYGIDNAWDGTTYGKVFKQLYQDLDIDYPRFYKMDPLCQLGFLLAEGVVKKGIAEVPEDKRGIFLMNRYSSINADLRFQASLTNGKASPSAFVYTLPNIVIGELSIRHRAKGEHAFFLLDEIELKSIYLYIQSLFDHCEIEGAFVGYCEVCPEGYSGTMGWMSQTGPEGGRAMKEEEFEQWIDQDKL